MAELAATIAHEINQPLAAITANGSACLRSLQRDPPLLDNAREAAACIVADGHRAGDVIARIRALFNKEQPRQQLLDLNEIVGAVLDLSRGAMERQRVTVRTELADPPPLVRADPVQLQQVIVNLVTNALEAMDRHPRGRARGSDGALARSTARPPRSPSRTPAPASTPIGSLTSSTVSTRRSRAASASGWRSAARSSMRMAGAMWAAPGTPTGAIVGFKLPLRADANGALKPSLSAAALHERIIGVSLLAIRVS